MGKIYYGKRGSGKTITLLKQAEALVDEGLTPVIVCTRTAFIDLMKSSANNANINTDNFKFISYNELKGSQYLTDPKCRIMIDELTVFLRDILDIKNMNNFYGTVSSEELKEVNRGFRNKNYIN